MRKGLIVIVILIGIGIAISLGSRDIPHPDVTDLVVERPEVSSNENAYTYLNLATNSLYMPTNSSLVTDYLEGKTVPEEVVREVIARNEEVFGAIEKGIQCRICLAPEVTGFDSLLPYIAEWRNMARVMAVKARHERLSGGNAEAALTCASLLHFGNLIQHDAECIINYLVGIAVLEIGLQQTRDLARDAGSTDCELLALSAALAQIGPFEHGLIRAIKVEYKVVSNTLDDFASGKFTMDEITAIGNSEPAGILKGRRIPRYFFQPNKTKAGFANFYRDMIKNAPLVYSEMNLYDVEESLGLKQSKFRLMTRPNSVGKILYALMIPALESLLERKCRTETSIAATSLLASLHHHKQENGAFPEKLDVLVPDFIAALPSDPYDGRPFRYVPSEGVIYAVGPDLEDSGGSSAAVSGHESDPPRKKRWYGEDVVFRIEKKEPAQAARQDTLDGVE